jgi:hypothetical protein
VGDQQDYGMRIYDPRVGRFLSIDPLTMKYSELTPYQFASNTPIWATDLDGKEANYKTINVFETYDPQGKLISVTSKEVEDKDRAAGWHLHNGWIPSYTFQGKLGQNHDGTLYTLVRTKIQLRDQGIEDMTSETVGYIYADAPMKPEKDRPVSNMPFEVMIWGSGTDPSDNTGDAPNPKAKSIGTFDYSQWSDLLEPLLLVKTPEEVAASIKEPELLDIIEEGTNIEVEKFVEEEKKKLHPDKSVYCKNCQGNYIYRNGMPTYETTNEKATDTVDHHEPLKSDNDDNE